MKRLKNFLIGIGIGLIYAFLTMLIVQASHRTVSIGYVFALPLILGAIPVIFSTKAQLESYLVLLIVPWVGVGTFFFLSFLAGFEGLICLVIIVGPFLLLGSLGAFIYRLIKLKLGGDDSKKLYISLIIPFLVLGIESFVVPNDYYGTVTTKILVNADKETVWKNIKNVRNIEQHEI